MIPEDSVVNDIFEAMREMSPGESPLFQDFEDGLLPGPGTAIDGMRDGFRDMAEETIRQAKQQAGEMTERVVAVFRSPRASDTIAPDRALFDRKIF